MNRWFVQQAPAFGPNVWDEIDAPAWKDHNDHTNWLTALQSTSDQHNASIDGVVKTLKEFFAEYWQWRSDNTNWINNYVNPAVERINMIQQCLREVLLETLKSEYAEKFAWLGQQVEELRKDREEVSRQMAELQKLKAELEKIKLASGLAY